MTDLVEFLRARLDEDEQAARECAGAPWSTPIPGQIHVDAKAIADNKLALGQLGYVATVLHEQDRQHIARHDPARVLWEVEAKRRILARHATCGTGSGYCDDGGHATDGVGCAELMDLAAPFSGEPGYKEDWAV